MRHVEVRIVPGAAFVLLLLLSGCGDLSSLVTPVSPPAPPPPQRTVASEQALRDKQEGERDADQRTDHAARQAAAEKVSTDSVRSFHERDEYVGLARRFKASGDPAWLSSVPDAALDSTADAALAALNRMREIEAKFKSGADRIAAGQVTFASVAVEIPGGADDAIRARVSAERACRADAKCISKREADAAEKEFVSTVVGPMCDADQTRESASATIANERANPSGVVDLDALHTAGEQLQGAKITLKNLAPVYAKARHHPWNGWRTECH